MTANKPEVVAWFKPASDATLNSVDAVITDRSMKDRPEISTMGFTEPLVRLSDYEALQAECEKLRTDNSELLAKLAAMESQRPHWAKGYSTDSIAAQVSGGALSELWELIGVSNQTDAVEKLQRMAAMESQEPEPYDAGCLNDYGGGNVSWWHDYIRAELDRAHDHYAEQFNVPADKPERITEQDVREIISSYEAHYYNDSGFNWWFCDTGAALLNKLNADREQAPVVAVPEITTAMYMAGCRAYHENLPFKNENVETIFKAMLAVVTSHSQQSSKLGYAGVTVWVGDKTCTQVASRLEMERTRADVLLRRFEDASRQILQSDPNYACAIEQGVNDESS